MNTEKYFILYTGPMFAGKSERIKFHIGLIKEQGLDCMILKPSLDTRQKNNIVLHSGQKIPAIEVDKRESVYQKYLDYSKIINKNPEFIIVDELQFFSNYQVNELCSIVKMQKSNLIACGLNKDHKGQPFQFRVEDSLPNAITTMEKLEELADSVIYLSSICSCQRPATYTFKKNLLNYDKNIEVGGKELYSPMCDICFSKETDLAKIQNIQNQGAKL